MSTSTAARGDGEPAVAAERVAQYLAAGLRAGGIDVDAAASSGPSLMLDAEAQLAALATSSAP
jgi:hypothetical protein